LFKTEGAEITTRLIEAQYPDYQQIIPAEFNTEVKISSQELAGTLKLTGLFAAESNNVEMQLSEADGIILTSYSQKAGSTTSKITTGKVKGENVKILFNHRYLLDCLNHIKQEHVYLKLINSAAPAMIVPDGDKDYLYLVMPIKT